MLILDILFPFSDRFLRGNFLSHVSYVSRGPHIDAILQHTPKLAKYDFESLPIAEHISFRDELFSSYWFC